jgi:hypothetical protein
MATPTTRVVLKVFLASPSDVAQERSSAQEVVNDLNKLLGRQFGLYIELYVWEDIAPGYGDPQTRINPDVDQCDLFIGLLWERWGQPTKKYTSGFEEEFERAIVRRRVQAQPEIWLVFKAPRPEKLDEPGPQLSQVIKFRDLQKSLREVHFAEVKNGDEWKGQLQIWLLKEAFRIIGDGIHVLGQPQPVSPAPAPSPSGEDPSLGASDPDRQGDRKAPKQLLDVSASVNKVLHSGQLELARDEANFLTEFDISRLYLLSATWMIRRYTADFMGTHQVNLLYKYRQRLQAMPSELYEILRTFLQDDSDVIPGWYWFRNDFPEGPSDALLYIATSDTNIRLRVSALKLLTAARVQIPHELWSSLPISDEAVSSEALEYLTLMGDDSAIPLIDQIEDLSFPDLTEAKIRIRLRTNPAEAFSDFVSSEKHPSSDLIREFSGVAAALSTENLLRGAASSAKELREVSVRELDRRGALSLELAEALRDDASIDVRQIALQKIVNERGLTEVDKLREAQPVSEWKDILAGKQEVDLKSLTLNYYRTRPTDELLSAITWGSIEGAPAYKILAVERYDHVANPIRSDLENGFDRIRTRWIEELRAILGAERTEEYLRDFEKRKLSEFIRSQFTEAALAGLEIHAEKSDVHIARKYLRDGNSDTALHAVKIVAKFGDTEDVQALLDISDGAWGELKDIALETAIRLASYPDQLALEMVKAGGPRAKAASKWLVERDSPDVAKYFRNLLSEQHDVDRLRGVYYFSKRLSNFEIEELLAEYMKNPTYYYSVVVWLDRLLYSPPPLKEMFIHKLEEQALS